MSSSESKPVPKFRPQLSLLDIECAVTALHKILETAIAENEEYIPSVEGHPIHILEVENTYKKLAIFKHKSEMGMTQPTYIQTFAKKGRKSAADIIIEGERESKQNNNMIKEKDTREKVTSAFSSKDIAADKLLKIDNLEDGKEKLTDHEFETGYKRLMERGETSKIDDETKAYCNKLLMKEFI